MDSTSTGLRMRRRGASLLAVAAFAVVALLWSATGARAAERLYWDNYGSEPATIGVANVDGSGASLLNLAGAEVLNPEGMAIDTAGGRVFVASSGETEYDAETETNKVTIPGKIVVANLDGSGATVFAPPGAPVDEPEGIAIDPATGLVFWANVGTGESKGSIAWAKLDGSAGGVLATPGVFVNGPYRIGVDPATARVFWDNAGDEPERIAFAAENGTGGGYLDITGATSPPDVSGFAVDSAAGRLYWIDHGKKYVSFANVGGGGGGDIDMSGAAVNSPYGLAFDPTLARLYWGNYGNGTEAIGAFGFSDLLGVGGGIDIAGVPVSGPQDPVILKSPTGTGAPALTRAKSSRSKLQCSTGSWAADYAGAFVYQAPTTYAYQWAKKWHPDRRRHRADLHGEVSRRLHLHGDRRQRGRAAPRRPRPAIKVKAAKLKLSTKKKAKAKAGKLVTFKLKAVNQGDLKTGKARVCVKLAGKAKKALKRPKCKQLGKIAGAKKETTKVKLRVKGTAEPGTYKLTFQPKGAKGTNAKAKVVVIG